MIDLARLNSGLVEPFSGPSSPGLYYDYNSGYYYDAERSLYYDGNTGNYLSFDTESHAFSFHSAVSPEEVEAQKVLRARAEEMKKHTIPRQTIGMIGC